MFGNISEYLNNEARPHHLASHRSAAGTISVGFSTQGADDGEAAAGGAGGDLAAGTEGYWGYIKKKC